MVIKRKFVVNVVKSELNFDVGDGRVRNELFVDRTVISCDWESSRLTACKSGISRISFWAGADGKMTLSLANRITGAFRGTCVDTRVINASAAIGTFFVGLAFASNAIGESISGITGWACANWTFALSPIKSRCTDRVSSAWIWSAKIFRHKLAAGDEGITSHVTWARTNWSQTA